MKQVIKGDMVNLRKKNVENHITTKSNMTSYHIQPPSHFPFQTILLNSVRVERLHGKANTNDPYHCSLRVWVVPQVFVNNFPHRFL